MADPFALMNRALDRSKGNSGNGKARKSRDPNNAKDREYLRAMHPDFDEVMASAAVDYKTKCQTDANFAGKFRMPPVVDADKTFVDHTNSVDAVCWGPDPGQFISGSHDATLKVWDVQTGKVRSTLAGHKGGIYHCAVSANRKLVVSCGSGESENVILWQWPQQTKTVIKGHHRSVVHATFSGDDLCAATADQDGNIIVHDLQRGAPKFQQTLHVGSAHASSFCREEPNLLCTAGADGSIQVLDLREALKPPAWKLPSVVANYASMQTTLGMHRAHDGYAVHAVEFASRQTLYSGGADCKCKRWDLRRMEPFMPKCAGEYLGHTASVRSLAVAPDERFIVTGCEDGSSRVWAKDTLGDARASIKGLKSQIQELETKLQNVTDPVAGQDLQRQRGDLRLQLATVRANEEQLARDGHHSALRTLNGHTGLVAGCAWLEDNGKTTASILSCSWDQTIRLYNLSLQTLH